MEYTTSLIILFEGLINSFYGSWCKGVVYEYVSSSRVDYFLHPSYHALKGFEVRNYLFFWNSYDSSYIIYQGCIEVIIRTWNTEHTFRNIRNVPYMLLCSSRKFPISKFTWQYGMKSILYHTPFTGYIFLHAPVISEFLGGYICNSSDIGLHAGHSMLVHGNTTAFYYGIVGIFF